LALAAYPATLKIGANSIQDIMTFELPFKMDMAETTAFSGSGGATIGTKTYIPTLYGMAVKATGSWAAKSDTNGQALLEAAFFARTSVTVIVAPLGTSNTYTYTAYISDYTIKGDPKKQVETDFTMTVTGSVSIV
jgi:hypothetical protein